jgi:hypothetical protein
MNEHEHAHEHEHLHARQRHGHGLMPLLLIPVLVSVARHMGRQRMRWAGADEAVPHGRTSAMNAAGVRLPPRLESILDAWHAKAHVATDATEAPTA